MFHRAQSLRDRIVRFSLGLAFVMGIRKIREKKKTIARKRSGRTWIGTREESMETVLHGKKKIIELIIEIHPKKKSRESLGFLYEAGRPGRRLVPDPDQSRRSTRGTRSSGTAELVRNSTSCQNRSRSASENAEPPRTRRARKKNTKHSRHRKAAGCETESLEKSREETTRYRFKKRTLSRFAEGTNAVFSHVLIADSSRIRQQSSTSRRVARS